MTDRAPRVEVPQWYVQAGWALHSIVFAATREDAIAIGMVRFKLLSRETSWGEIRSTARPATVADLERMEQLAHLDAELAKAGKVRSDGSIKR